MPVKPTSFILPTQTCYLPTPHRRKRQPTLVCSRLLDGSVKTSSTSEHHPSIRACNFTHHRRGALSYIDPWQVPTPCIARLLLRFLHERTAIVVFRLLWTTSEALLPPVSSTGQPLLHYRARQIDVLLLISYFPFSIIQIGSVEPQSRRHGMDAMLQELMSPRSSRFMISNKVAKASSLISQAENSPRETERERKH